MAAALALALGACGADAPDSDVEATKFRAEKHTVGDAASEAGEDIATIRARAESGDREAQFLLGHSLRTAETVTESAAKEGLEWIQKSADQGWPEAQFFLGRLFGTGELTHASADTDVGRWLNERHRRLGLLIAGEASARLARDSLASTKWYGLAADQGHSQARLALALIYGTGDDQVRENDEKAIVLLRQAADSGNSETKFKVARYFDDGELVAEDNVEAEKWYRLAAEQGYAEAQLNLGLMYSEGEGVAEDDVEAVKWYQLAAEQGVAHAQFILGIMYANGEGVTENDVEAVKWYRLAGEQEHASAQYNLGYMYSNGEGVTENDVEAVKWYRLAAEQGDANAQFILGLMYANGEGVPENDAEAVKWYRLAAEQGHASAQHNLGVMYRYGVGVAKSNETAYFWASLASASRDGSRKFRDEVKALLTGAQVQRTQARTAEWVPAATFEEAKERLSGALAADPKPERVRPAPAPAPTTVALSPSPSGPPIIKTSDRDSDIAVVTTSARLRASPAGEVLATIEAGAELALLGRAATDGWYEVIDIESGALGWIHESVLRLELAASPAPAAQIFQAQATGVDAPPEVKVENKANRTIWLRVGDQKYTIEAGQTLKVNVPAGSHRFNAWAAGVIPASGAESFNRGYTYNWSFWIKRL